MEEEEETLSGSVGVVCVYTQLRFYHRSVYAPISDVSIDEKTRHPHRQIESSGDYPERKPRRTGRRRNRIDQIEQRKLLGVLETEEGNLLYFSYFFPDDQRSSALLVLVVVDVSHWTSGTLR